MGMRNGRQPRTNPAVAVVAWVIGWGLGGVAVADDQLAAARKGCDAGKAAECTLLAGLYRDGKGVTRDPAMAAPLFRKACDGGDAAGCTYLGILYQSGTGVGRDEAAAASMFQRGCDGGEPGGCMASAIHHRMKDDEHSATVLFARTAALAQQACDSGRMVAAGEGASSGCALLGSLYSEGLGVPKDAARGARIFEKACSGGDQAGCFLLGVAYESGNGVRRDNDRAVALFKRACDLGFAGACQRPTK